MRAWRAANRERIKAYKKANDREGNRRRTARWEKNNPESGRRKSAKWAASNPDKHSLYHSRGHAKRKAKLLDAGSYTLEEWNALLDATGHKCAACGIQEAEAIYRYPRKGFALRGRLTRDHIVPLCDGGTNTIDNLQPLCLTCNMHKHRKTKRHIDSPGP